MKKENRTFECIATTFNEIQCRSLVCISNVDMEDYDY